MAEPVVLEHVLEAVAPCGNLLDERTHQTFGVIEQLGRADGEELAVDVVHGQERRRHAAFRHHGVRLAEK